ncbi:MAG: YegS/Rv2252/BmrU family lipid kinase [Oscillospiraceae bacterium]|nr:YegS/Rv2252/BmrU family lipid kinase [Oscillospiraceae bacterium]
MQKRIMLIINPISGRAQYKSEIPHILEVLCGRGAAVTVYMTQHSGHARELAESHAKRYDIVTCLGGDGTLAETISGLMELDHRPPIGYIPMGTTNDTATTLGLPKDATRAAEVILEGIPIPIDVGRFGQDYFTYIAAFGAFTEVSYQTPTENKRALGHLAYVLEGMGRLTKITPRKLTVEYDGTDGKGKIEGEFIFGGVTNTTSIAGLWKLKPHLVDLGDGAFEVILVKSPRNILEFNAIFMDIVTQKYNSEYVKLFKAKQVRFQFEEPVPWTRDGEAGGEHTEVNLHVAQPGVQIFVPREA